MIHYCSSYRWWRGNAEPNESALRLRPDATEKRAGECCLNPPVMQFFPAQSKITGAAQIVGQPLRPITLEDDFCAAHSANPERPQELSS